MKPLPSPQATSRTQRPGHSLVPILSLLAVGTLFAASCRTAWRLRRSAALARLSVPIQQRPSHPSTRLLIVGDSTGVGTGASAPEHSLAGWLAQMQPDLWLENRACDGAGFRDLPAQLDAGRADAPPFDLVLILAGANDVVRLRSLRDLRRDIERVLRRAGDLAPQVIVMPAGNVGNAPLFFAPLSWLMSWRARILHREIRAAAARHRAVYVNLFKPRSRDPFVQHPHLLSADQLHPSDAGYATWFGELMAQAPDLAQRLKSAP